MAQMTAAQALIKSLVREGVDVIFGMPGIQIMDVYEALYDEPSIRAITVRHEQSATYMADGYARSTGKIGVSLVVPGPGLLNASVGVGTAYATSSPILLISGQIDTTSIGKNRGAVHEMANQLGVLENITKWRTRITAPQQVPETIQNAMRHLKSGRPRPVAIEIPVDVLAQTSEVALREPEIVPKIPPDAALSREAARLLAQAQRPVVWVGGGVTAADAHEELTQLVEAVNAAVIVTAEGKGSLSEEHPNYAGPYYYGHGVAHEVVPKADVILAVGSRLNIGTSTTWAFNSDQILIRIDADEAELARNWPEQVSICADAKLALRGVLQELNGRSVASEWSHEEISGHRQSGYQFAKGCAPNQVRIIESLRQVLDNDAIVVSGITNIGYWAHLTFPALTPRSYLNTSYFATLGFAFPTALGAKIGNPSRQVIALCGDGGFMYGLSELATAVQEGINVVAIVFNDSALGATLTDQNTRYKGRAIGTRMHTPDFAKLAHSFGADGVRLKTDSELPDALRAAVKSERPVVIETPIESWTPPFQITPPATIQP